VGDAEAPKADAKPREADAEPRDAGPEWLTQTLDVDARRFRGAYWG